MFRQSKNLFCYSICIIVTLFVFGWSADRYVPSQYSTIQSAIDAAASYDNIMLTGTITETFKVPSTKTHLTFQTSPNSPRAVLYLLPEVEVFANYTTFKNLTIMVPDYHYGIYVTANYTYFTQCDFYSQLESPNQNHGIQLYGKYLTVDHCNFYNLRACIGGDIYSSNYVQYCNFMGSGAAVRVWNKYHTNLQLYVNYNYIGDQSGIEVGYFYTTSTVRNVYIGENTFNLREPNWIGFDEMPILVAPEFRTYVTDNTFTKCYENGGYAWKSGMPYIESGNVFQNCLHP